MSDETEKKEPSGFRIKGGRPPEYETPEEIIPLLDDYFSTRSKENPPTISGMALHLGFANRSSIYKYQKKEEFRHIMSAAVTHIVEWAEKQILTNTGRHTGAIYWLNNHGWKNVQDFNVQSDNVNRSVEARVNYDDMSEADKKALFMSKLKG